MKKVSLSDISKELGVSKTLVSFVMNGRAKEKRINDEVAKKVLAKAKELGYKADYLARAMRTGKSQTIGLVMADISNPFFSKLARSIENEIAKFGYNVIFGSSDEDHIKSGKLIEVFKDKKVDGLIICPTVGDKNHIKKLNKEKYPYVLVDRYFKEIPSNNVMVDNYGGSFEIVDNQIKSGRKKIAFINFNVELINMMDRFHGYLEALKVNGYELDNTLVKNVSFKDIEKETYEAMEELLNVNPKIDSIYFANNRLAFLGIKYLIENNINDLKKLQLSSFDGFDFMPLMQMHISYGIQPIEQLGISAVDSIMKQINNKEESSKHAMLPMDLSLIN
ncbi:LacI family transcriptional regulator [Gelidibacter sediminis]|uniref:LacI family transcriptional regulator n=1 Tax=Gelidibacter sediminis TaxID=1608710 RepID=A0A4V6Q4L5_9FLAO|nr:LacI family DNA-binding transcriptional regulator [Gelidibacter sediminis]TDU39796.1 LacI family transcriptional regulator [Gelidibacter sediminis]